MGMTRPEASRVVAVLLGAFPHARITDQTPVVYEDALMDLDYAHVDAAVRSLILTEREFIPTVAKIREAAIERRDGRRRPGGDAFKDVRRAVGSYGIDRTPKFADPIVARVVDALGWREFCKSDEGDASYRARFVQLYDQYAAMDKQDRQVQGVLEPAKTHGQLGAGEAVKRAMLRLVGPDETQASRYEADVRAAARRIDEENKRDSDDADAEPPWERDDG